MILVTRENAAKVSRQLVEVGQSGLLASPKVADGYTALPARNRFPRYFQPVDAESYGQVIGFRANDAHVVIRILTGGVEGDLTPLDLEQCLEAVAAGHFVEVAKL